MKIYYIPLYPYSCDPLKNETHPERILELYKKAEKNSGEMFTISVPDGICKISAPKLEPSARPPPLTADITHLMASVMHFQLEKILQENDPDKPTHSWLYIYDASLPHRILRDALAEAYSNKGQELMIEPIEHIEKRIVTPRTFGYGKK